MTVPRRILPNTTYLVTRRCLGRRFLLRPDPTLNRLFLYSLTLAADKYGIAIHGFCVMSNHYHLVVTDVHGVLPNFMCWLNCQLAKRIKRLRKWDEVVWEPNVHYNAVELEGEAEALDKVAYTLLNPVSAHLVERSEDWPGLVSTLQMLQRGMLQVKRPKKWFKDSLPESLTLSLVPPPCFPDQDAYLEALGRLSIRRRRVLQEQRSRDERRVLGPKAVRKTPVHSAPTTPKERFGRSPSFSALTRQAWRRALTRLRSFRAAYRRAYAAWRGGTRDAEFPAGTWWLVRCANVVIAS